MARMYESADDIKANYIKLMGPSLGADFHELMQDAARLHLKWNEFLPLYAGPKSRVDEMNKAAPGFFFLAQNAWWNDIILHIFRMTDPDRKVLSILKLKVPPDLATGFQTKLTMLKAATRFAHKLRHEYIAHRNREVALEVRPVPPSSVADVNRATAAIDDALHFIDHHFSKRAPTMYEHLDILGGSESLIWIVRRGLVARDEDIAQHRPFMRFPD
jgi:AbiU2